jgi:hypothetical protein
MNIFSWRESFYIKKWSKEGLEQEFNHENEPVILNLKPLKFPSGNFKNTWILTYNCC